MFEVPYGVTWICDYLLVKGLASLKLSTNNTNPLTMGKCMTIEFEMNRFQSKELNKCSEIIVVDLSKT